MLKQVLATIGLAAATLVVPALAANDPTVQQIYQAASSGQLPQAQRMIDQVLKDHPRSGKAHFVAAELAARQGQAARARTELASAEALAPGLPFVRARSVAALKAQLGLAPPRLTTGPTTAARRFPWGSVLLLGGLVALFVMLLRRRNPPLVYPAAPGAPGYPPTGYPGGAGPGGYGPGVYGPGAYGPGAYGPPAGGVGSGIAGGLASGLALGAGVVAGEALAHRFLDGSSSVGGVGGLAGDEGLTAAPPNTDLGGADFGITDDPGSWDDSSAGGADFGGGGDDWS